MDKETKKELIAKFRIHEKDGGSSDVQIAVLTERIKELSEHLKTHKKDQHTRYGLLKLVQRRRKLISYLKKTDGKRFESIAQSLQIK